MIFMSFYRASSYKTPHLLMVCAVCSSLMLWLLTRLPTLTHRLL